MASNRRHLFSQFWKLEILDEGVGKVMLSEGSWRGSFFASFWLLVVAYSPWVYGHLAFPVSLVFI